MGSEPLFPLGGLLSQFHLAVTPLGFAVWAAGTKPPGPMCKPGNECLRLGGGGSCGGGWRPLGSNAEDTVAETSHPPSSVGALVFGAPHRISQSLSTGASWQTAP